MRLVLQVKKKPVSAEKSPEEARSYTMSRIRCADTKIEVAFRRALWRAGIRFRKNFKGLPGKPDIAITRHKIAIFCDGEFWHGKDWSAAREKIRARRDYWVPKIERTMERDSASERRLAALGWTVLRFWGRDIQKSLDLCVAEVMEAILCSKAEASGGWPCEPLWPSVLADLDMPDGPGAGGDFRGGGE